MIKINEKKGEMTTKQIVSLIILILSFSVILFLIFRLDLGQITNEEICKNSVILKGKSPLGTGNLDCKTDYICISGGGDCEGINPTKTIEISSKDGEEGKNEVMKVLAEEMASCWFIFGEGKVNYGSKSPFEGIKTEYAVCSIVEFSEEIEEEITYQEFYNYLETTKKTNSQTYLQYLYGISDVSLVPTTDNIKIDLASDEISTSQKYSIITGIDNKFGTGEKFRPDDVLKVYIIPTSEISSRLTNSRDFITKA